MVVWYFSINACQHKGDSTARNGDLTSRMVVFSLRVGGPLSAAQFAKFRFQDSELIPRLDDNSHIVYVYIHIYVHMMYTYIYI